MPQISLQRALIGHRRPAEFLNRVLATGCPSHAYLFHGPSRVGKTTLALAVAQALNCAAGSEEVRPCGQCRPCRLIAAGHHPDVRTIGILGQGQEGPGQSARRSRGPAHLISIDQVRALEHEVALAPYEGRWKVYVVVGAELLSLDAMNFLLKTLEEPPSQVVLLLTTIDAGLLLPTIVSRCQQVRLAAVPPAEIAVGLRERYGVEPSRAELLASLSDGRVGWAIGALDDPGILEERAQRLSDLRDLEGARLADRFAYAEKLAQDCSKDPERVTSILSLWLGWWRDLLLIHGRCPDRVGNRDRLDDLTRQAERLSVQQIHSFLRAIQAALENLAQNVNPRLALDVLLLELPAAPQTTGPLARDTGARAPVR